MKGKKGDFAKMIVEPVVQVIEALPPGRKGQRAVRLSPIPRSPMRRALRRVHDKEVDVEWYYKLCDDWRDDEVSHENDRGNALILGAYAERVLENTIARCLIREAASAPLYDRVFGADEAGAINGFAGKIVLGYALGLYTEQVREDLQTIRHIRNVFAHAVSNVDFTTPEIAEACNFYIVNRTWGGGKRDSREWLDKASARQKFVTGVFWTIFRIITEAQEQKRPVPWRIEKIPKPRPNRSRRVVR
jgi:hypothetical protein